MRRVSSRSIALRFCFWACLLFLVATSAYATPNDEPRSADANSIARTAEHVESRIADTDSTISTNTANTAPASDSASNSRAGEINSATVSSPPSDIAPLPSLSVPNVDSAPAKIDLPSLLSVLTSSSAFASAFKSVVNPANTNADASATATANAQTTTAKNAAAASDGSIAQSRSPPALASPAAVPTAANTRTDAATGTQRAPSPDRAQTVQTQPQIPTQTLYDLPVPVTLPPILPTIQLDDTDRPLFPSLDEFTAAILNGDALPQARAHAQTHTITDTAGQMHTQTHTHAPAHTHTSANGNANGKTALPVPDLSDCPPEDAVIVVTPARTRAAPATPANAAVSSSSNGKENSASAAATETPAQTETRPAESPMHVQNATATNSSVENSNNTASQQQVVLPLHQQLPQMLLKRAHKQANLLIMAQNRQSADQCGQRLQHQ